MKKKIILVLSMVALLACMLALAVSASCYDTGHKGYWTISATEKGYLGEIKAVHICTDCGGTIEKETINPLFVTLGYSYNLNGGITQHYAADRDAIARYEELTGEKVRFGAVAAVKSNVPGDPLDKDGLPVNEKVRAVDFTDTEYDVFDVIVNGIPESYQTNTGIICSAYIMVGKNITYIDNGVEKTNAVSNTFADVCEIVDNELEGKADVPVYKYINGVKYKVLSAEDLGLTKYAYYNSDTNSKLVTSDNAGTYLKYFATKKFTKEDLPNGTIVTIDTAYIYRPEGWDANDKKVGSRPGTSSKSFVVDAAWWGSYVTRAFNISYKTPSKFADSVTVDDIAEKFQIYVPVEEGSINKIIPPLNDPEFVFDSTADNEKQNWDDDGALKILCIGNSFSEDSTKYLYDIAKAAGIEKVVIGNLYIGGCSLATHLTNLNNNSASYKYYYNNSGSWKSIDSYKISTAVKSDDWDFITIQQVSGNSGVADTYDDLNAILNIVEPMNPSARLVWHMTWAYQQGSSHSDFNKYGKDQMTMYNAIVNAVQTKIVTNDKIEIIIPAGTAIQNARTSYIGDKFTRDGYHLNDLGKYIGGLTFVKALTGVSINKISYKLNDMSTNQLNVAIDAVNKAYATPFAVTTSAYVEEPKPNVSLEGLVQVEYMDWLAGSYWWSSDKDHFNFRVTSESNSPNFWATRWFTKEQLPVGTVIIISENWQYRPEGWIDEKTVTTSRPDNVTTQVVVIDEAWWGNFTIRGFNISKTSGSNISGLTEADINKAFQIYVPQSAAEANKKPTGGEVVEPEVPETPDVTEVKVDSKYCVDEVTVINGVEYRALTMEAMGITAFSYYWSEKTTEFYTLDKTMARRYFATTKFGKDILVDGAVIYIAEGWLYRPEGWVDNKLNSSSTRPGEVSKTYTTIDSAWWGDFTTRAFNIAMQPEEGTKDKPFLDEKGYDTAEEIYEMFKIYIPVDKIAE